MSDRDTPRDAERLADAAARAQSNRLCAAAIGRRLQGVDLTGGASTMEDSPFRRKQRQAVAAKGAAMVQAFTSSGPGGTSLLEMYDQWRRQELTKKLQASGADHEAVERRAMRKGRKRVRKLLASGASAPQALRGGHRRYVEHGDLDFAHWCDQV